MKLPIGFYKKEKAAGQVCKLVKSLYGLKQASRQWFAKFSEAITDFGFQRSLNNYSLFTMTRDGDFMILLVYVDDVIVTATSSTLIFEVKQYIHDKFRIKDLGLLKYFLGLEVARSDDGIFLNQRKYAIELLEDNNLLQCKPAKSPMNTKHKLSLSTEALLPDALPYRKLIGKLIYMSITKPDLAYPIHILSQYMQSPTEEHMRAALRLLRYIKNAPAQGIMFSAYSSLQLQAFCDADWVACPLPATACYLGLVSYVGRPKSNLWCPYHRWSLNIGQWRQRVVNWSGCPDYSLIWVFLWLNPSRCIVITKRPYTLRTTQCFTSGRNTLR
ncbi:unnamed protein product [Rhodiola kirilowii]